MVDSVKLEERNPSRRLLCANFRLGKVSVMQQKPGINSLEGYVSHVDFPPDSLGTND